MQTIDLTPTRGSSPVAPPQRRARPGPVAIVAIAIGAGVLLLAGLVAAVLITRPAATYPAGSPEAAFQAYLFAYRTGDVEAAYGAFSGDVRSRLTLAQYKGLDADQRRWQAQEDPRIVLDRTDRTAADRVTLQMTIEHFNPGVFGSSRWTEPLSVRMVREAGAWRIDDPLLGTQPAPYMGP